MRAKFGLGPTLELKKKGRRLHPRRAGASPSPPGYLSRWIGSPSPQQPEPPRVKGVDSNAGLVIFFSLNSIQSPNG